MSLFDLHMHSDYSVDGDVSVEKLVQIAKENNLKCIALSDHNCTHGDDAFLKAAQKANILAIPAIEFSTSYEDGETHLLGYNIDYHKPYYETLPQNSQKLKDEAGKIIVQKLAKMFSVEINIEEIMQESKEKDSDPYIIFSERLLNDPKSKENVLLQPYLPGGKRSDPATVNLYWDYCVKDCPCFVSIPFPSIKETIERIHNDGGIAVLAHPWKIFYKQEEKLLELISYGLDGIEAYSNYHEPFHNEYYEDFCKRHNLLMTCGSDFHGSMKPSIQMGEYGYTKDKAQEILDAFLQRIQRKED